MPQEYKPHFDSYKGLQEEKDIRSAQNFQHGYSFEKGERYKKHRVELPERQERLIAESQRAVDAVLRSYGVDPVEVPREHITVVTREAFKDIMPNKVTDGLYAAFSRHIVLAEPSSDLSFASALNHELLHAKAYQAGVARSTEKGVQIRNEISRSGIAIVRTTDKGTTDYFGEINEAITEELNIQVFEEQLRNEPSLQEDIKKVDEIRNFFLKNIHPGTEHEFRIQMVLSIIHIAEPEKLLEIIRSDDPLSKKFPAAIAELDALIDTRKLCFNTYYEWRDKFEDLLEDIAEASNGMYETPHDVFKEFVKAQFTGKLLPLARSMEKILGRGTFRSVGKNSRIDSEETH